jgi:hypothetical protein
MVLNKVFVLTHFVFDPTNIWSVVVVDIQGQGESLYHLHNTSKIEGFSLMIFGSFLQPSAVQNSADILQ